jgi:hypothetical protein
VGKRNRHVVTIDSFEDVPPNNEVALMKVHLGLLIQYTSLHKETTPWRCALIDGAYTSAAARMIFPCHPVQVPGSVSSAACIEPVFGHE